MKIRIIENEVKRRNVMEHGNIKEVVEEHMPTGRSWDIDLPFEPVALKDVWLGIVCDLQNLIETFRRARHD